MIETGASKSFAEKAGVECSDGALSPYHRVARGESAETSTERRRYTAPLLGLNLVCLDAPIVAISWLWLFARTFSVPLSVVNSLALFLTAWLIYLADRFGDSVSLPSHATMSRRQEVCARHRKGWICAICFVAMADVTLIAARLEASVLAIGVAIGAVAMIYLVVNHHWSQVWRILPLKEVTIGFLFAAGTIASLLPAFSAWTPSFILAAVLFALLCALNCICIARWESALDAVQGRNSIATAWPSFARLASVATLGLGIASLALTFSIISGFAVFGCVGVSALGLTALDRFGGRLSRDVRTACADLVLLTPALLALLG